MPQSVDVWLPKGWIYNGAKHPTCTLATLASGGPRACPPQSIVGTGDLGHRREGDGDTTFSRQGLAIINGGPRAKVYFWICLAVRSGIRPASGHGHDHQAQLFPRWSSRLHIDIPPRLQVVATIPVALSSSAGTPWAATGSPRPTARATIAGATDLEI